MILCLATSSANTLNMGSFIQAHSTKLPVELLLYGGEPPILFNDDEKITPSLLGALKNLSGLLMKRISLKELYRLAIISRITEVMKKNKVSVVLAEYGVIGTFMLKPCQELGIPLVVHFHGYDAFKKSILDSDIGHQYEQLFRFASALIVVSEAMKMQIMKLGAPECKIQMIRCGCDSDLYTSCTPSENPARFIAVGRFVDKKAQYLTILAFSILKKQYPEAHLELIGSGPLEEVCFRLTQALDLSDSVLFRGSCSHEYVASRMRCARAFVQHSLVPSMGPDKGDSEGTPVSVMEAMMTGLPVIATRHAGIGEIITHEKTGLLVAEGDVDDMARHMSRVLSDLTFADALGKAARLKARKEFCLEKSISELEDVLLKVTL